MRRRIALTVLAVTAMVTLAFTVPFAAVIRTVAGDQALIAADQESQSLASVLSAAVTTAELRSFMTQLNATNTRKATVITANGDVVGEQIAVPKDDLTVARNGRAFTATWDGATRVLVPVHLANGAVDVGIVSVPNNLLHHGVIFAWVILGAVSIVILLLGVAFADRLARSLIASVRQLGTVTRKLELGQLEARSTLDGPKEIREVGNAVNSLAARIVEMLNHERESAADISHRLRTPLMAMQLEAEGLDTETDRQKMSAAIGKLTAAVTMVIRSARGEGEQSSEVSDLTDIVTERIAFWSVLAEDQGRQWQADLLPQQLLVQVNHEELVATIDALLTNVFSHTADGVGFSVATTISDGVVLVVEDNGAGYPEGLIPTRGKSDIGSTGLGLDIVAQTARRAGGDLTLSRGRSGGACARVRFGAVIS